MRPRFGSMTRVVLFGPSLSSPNRSRGQAILRLVTFDEFSPTGARQEWKSPLRPMMRSSTSLTASARTALCASGGGQTWPRSKRGCCSFGATRGLPVHEVRHPVGVPHIAVALPAEVPQSVARLLRGDSAEVFD